MYVCVCKAVTDSQILTAIAEGVCTRKQLTQCFGVGRDCGKCNPDIHSLLHTKTLDQAHFPAHRLANAHKDCFETTPAAPKTSKTHWPVWQTTNTQVLRR